MKTANALRRAKGDARYNEDGDDLEDPKDDRMVWERYFATHPGTQAARIALDAIIQRSRKK